MPLSPEAFIRELDEQNRRALDRIALATTIGEPDRALSVKRLLLLALKNELEATEIAAAWIGTTPEIDAKLGFARQAADEAKHYRLIEKRLGELGVDTSGYDPFVDGRSPLHAYLLGVQGTCARIAAGQFTREALAVVRNAEFIVYCEETGDQPTATLYKSIVQPDEHHHHELGRKLLLKLATTDEAQSAARAASRRCLELAEELQEIARIKAGITRAPGC